MPTDEPHESQAAASQPMPAEVAELHTLAHVATPSRPGKSFRHIAEPCEKHAAKPPGEQSWNDDGTKQRDPNGFDHGCPDCQAKFAIVEEG